MATEGGVLTAAERMDDARRRGAETRRRRARTKIFASAVRQAQLPGRRRITVATICQEAKISQATFYYHYDSVEELLTEVLQQSMKRVVRKIEDHPKNRFYGDYPKEHYDYPENRLLRVIEILVSELMKFPNLFVSGGSREWVRIVAAPLVSELKTLEHASIDAHEGLAEIIAEYHVTSWIGFIEERSVEDAISLIGIAISQLYAAVMDRYSFDAERFYESFASEVDLIARRRAQP